MTLLHKLGFKDKMRCKKIYNMFSSKHYSYSDFNEFRHILKTFFSKFVSSVIMKSRFKQIIFKLSPLFDLKLILNESILTLNLTWIKSSLIMGFPLYKVNNRNWNCKSINSMTDENILIEDMSKNKFGIMTMITFHLMVFGIHFHFIFLRKW